MSAVLAIHFGAQATVKTLAPDAGNDGVDWLKSTPFGADSAN